MKSTLAPMRDLGASEKLETAIQTLKQRGLCHGVMLAPDGHLDLTAAIFLACGAQISLLNQSGGDPQKAGLSPLGAILATELIRGFEALVDEDITIWGDNHTAEEAVQSLKRLSGYYK